MDPLSAFVAHSFSETDEIAVRPFLEFLDRVAAMGMGFSWDHADPAEPRAQPDPRPSTIQGKNLLVAICTPHERTIQPDHLSPMFLRAPYLKAKKEHVLTKVSDWILQEIGCAVGMGMRIIVLLEQGVRGPGGLQGDIEYIPFERERPEASFNKILEMLESLSAPPSATRPFATSGLGEAPEEPGPSQPAATVEEQPDETWTKADFDDALYFAIGLDDRSREASLSEAYHRLIAGDDAREQARWKGLSLFYRASIRKEDTLPQMLKLKDQFPEHAELLSLVGRTYEAYNEPSTAASLLQLSSDLSPDLQLKTRRLCRAAVNHANAGNSGRAMECLAQATSFLRDAPGAEHQLFQARADVAKLTKADSAFEAFTEALLELRPDDHQRRFALAYHYGRKEEHDLAYYHYRTLVDRSPNEGYFNNLGVAASNLQLPAAAVLAYRQSESLGGTLAMSNLAHKLLDEGFLTEAEQIANDAMRREGYDRKIGSVLARVKSITESEEKKQEEILQALQRRRLTYIDFAAAATDDSPDQIPGRWNGPDSELILSLHEGKLKAEGSYEKKSVGFATQLATAFGQKTPASAMVYVLFLAQLIGRAGEYRQWISEGKPPDTNKDKHSQTGIFILSTDSQVIQVYQSGSRDNEAFYQLTAGEPAAAGSAA